MNPTYLLAGLLTAAALVVDWAVAAQLPARPDAALLVYSGLAFGQLALVGMWSALGRTQWLLRFLAVVAVSATLSEPFASATAGRWPEWFLVLCLYGGTVAFVTAALRRSGLQAWRSDSALQPLAPRRKLASFQFTLGGLLSCMTLAGLLLGLARYVAFPWRYATALACYGTCLSLVALVALWALVGRHATVRRLGLLVGSCLAVGVAMYHVERVRDSGFFMLVALIEALVICLGVTVLQTAGLRIGIGPVRES